MITRLGESLVYAFSNGTYGGNPSFVIVTSGQWQDSQSECIRRAQNLGVEVTHLHFLDKPSLARVRFYVESGLLAFCGHGSLAAGAWAVKAGMVQDCLHLDYGFGTLSLKMNEYGKNIGFLDQSGQLREVPIVELLLFSLRTVLGLPSLKFDSVKLWVGGRQRTKAIVCLPSRDFMQFLKIDPLARDVFCQQLGVTGVYPFFQIEPGRIAARHFPLGAGMGEDLATGNIASTLAEYLAHPQFQRLVIEQGGVQCNSAYLEVQCYGMN